MNKFTLNSYKLIISLKTYSYLLMTTFLFRNILEERITNHKTTLFKNENIECW